MDLHLARIGSSQASLFDGPATGSEGKGLLVGDEEAMRLYDESWIDEWYESRNQHDEYRAKGKKAVRNLLRAYKDTPPNITHVERPFTLVLSQHSIKGMVARIDNQPDGTYAIVDYKTGWATEKL